MIVNKFETEDDITIFRLNGKLIDSTLDSPKSGIDSALDDGHLWLAVNCDELQVVDQAGAGFLLSRIRQTRKKGGELCCANLGLAIKTLLAEIDGGITLSLAENENDAIDLLRALRKQA